MRVVIQRVLEASVVVDEKVVGAIGNGLLVLLGIEDADTEVL
jgi:D-tyrosyl-tRNA(Tyr) deacylase